MSPENRFALFGMVLQASRLALERAAALRLGRAFDKAADETAEG